MTDLARALLMEPGVSDARHYARRVRSLAIVHVALVRTALFHLGRRRDLGRPGRGPSAAIDKVVELEDRSGALHDRRARSSIDREAMLQREWTEKSASTSSTPPTSRRRPATVAQVDAFYPQ
jgi:hypothetical protein